MWHGSLGSLQALRLAADEARDRQAALVPVVAWTPPGGDFAERSHPSPYLREIWREAARLRLAEAFDAGLGGVPDDIAGAGAGRARRGGPGARRRRRPPRRPARDRDQARRSYIGRALRKSVGRYCLAHAKCPVLAAPPSALMEELGHGGMKRSWSLRGRRVLNEIDREIEHGIDHGIDRNAPSHGVC